MNKKTRIRLLIFGSLLSLLVFGGYYLIEYTIPKLCVKPWRVIPAENKWLFPKGYKPEDFGLEGQKIAIRTPDGLQLIAWQFESKLDTTFGTVVLLHGISNCKESNFSRAQLLADSGYASLLLDLRAHGESEGEYCTFGYFEKNDVKAVADTLKKQHPDRPVAIWGTSLGGAIALQTMAEDPRFSFGIIESTFDEFHKVIGEYAAAFMLGLRPEWILDRVIYKAGAIAHFDPNMVDPVKAAAKIDQPMLFLHGDKDARIPKAFNKRNFEAVPNAQKQWVSVPGAGHNNLWAKEGEQLQKIVFSFLADGRSAN